MLRWSSMEEMPPGFRFYPTEEELISFYLTHKLQGRRQDLDRVIPSLDVYNFNPWDLPQYAGEFSRLDPEQWFFFIPRQEKESRGGRPSRLTELGYWKATGSPGFVYSSAHNRIIGEKRTMVFYKGRAPHGEKTEWKMNEYTAIDHGEASSSTTSPPKLRQELSLCRVYIKSKCLRAFDRRPSGVEINELGRSQIRAPDVDELPRASISHRSQNQPQPLMVRRNSPNHSSSSGNHAPTLMEIETSSSSNNNNRADNSSSNFDPLWEWEQLNWF